MEMTTEDFSNNNFNVRSDVKYSNSADNYGGYRVYVAMETVPSFRLLCFTDGINSFYVK